MEAAAPGFEALRVHLNRNDYRHDEKAGDAVENFFKTKRKTHASNCVTCP